MTIQDMLSTGSWSAACVEGRRVGGQHRIELMEEEERGNNNSDCSFRLRFLDTGKLRHVSNSDVESASMVKRERRVVNGKVPRHTPFHFLSLSSKILVFAESP